MRMENQMLFVKPANTERASDLFVKLIRKKNIQISLCLFNTLFQACVSLHCLFSVVLWIKEACSANIQLEQHACKCVWLIQLFYRPVRVIASVNDTI